MRTDDFDYNLPEELIAQEPAASGATSAGCSSWIAEAGKWRSHLQGHHRLPAAGRFARANETRVMPPRLLGAKRHGRGGRGVSAARVRRPGAAHEPRGFLGGTRAAGQAFEAGRRAVVDFSNAAGEVVLSAEIIDWARDGQRGERVARLSTPLASLDEALHALGHTPLPPHIRAITPATRVVPDRVLAPQLGGRAHGRASATPELIGTLRERGIGWAGRAGGGAPTPSAWWMRRSGEAPHPHRVLHGAPCHMDAVNATHAAGGPPRCRRGHDERPQPEAPGKAARGFRDPAGRRRPRRPCRSRPRGPRASISCRVTSSMWWTRSSPTSTCRAPRL